MIACGDLYTYLSHSISQDDLDMLNRLDSSGLLDIIDEASKKNFNKLNKTETLKSILLAYERFNY
jgi:hypothetical protein